MANIPSDPVMLLSYVNTQLRDFYPDIKELCGALSISEAALNEKLNGIDYWYDKEKNQYL